MSVIAVVDYDMGNLHSVCKGLENVGAVPKITDSPAIIEQADAVVLPGVGSFDPAMQNLRSRNLIEPIKSAIASGKPFLGICLGLQILFESSEEGVEPGLGVISGKVRRFQSEPGLTIPHMGWNQLEFAQPNQPLWEGLPSDPWVYFVHSYYVDPVDLKVRSAMVTHGSQNVTAAIAKDNLMAVQFHPEKSSSTGLHMLSNFVSLVRTKVAA
ncbi:MAG: imidazole glycerol phosphate synthase subunit HisH [Microcoleus sp. PH2017_29_MFU_D_A]|jgi:imidazole glycerol-phosphate synthase subunit HisH|uniref:imidazole glycerol phosphate synthase subunit HisH n=1 Tax=unclassified Microcoleus TaxID=2642155 RepID=UPI001DC329C8|nr:MULTISPECIES: imidazole glycerol phosphate synthase subunit HisH [unclassified Microcoleus]MCC3421530.1 imidazole glycerol phosphate synthase subunit HisH [Microcoleus sp. PH2017_07_MST_O_A]MCC3430540.1 imidazole glycerol phosphate synthase subunit HisH [Microcoleus sp. PH2017_04_SCI_O_A]MCC3442073.1 imidazole glycerol phosphate synthase subunit HisH [Microcoleus sp. PH2017_03_ELD_O_A]MCC3467625.1 imidazole glycerol phosphate synthase subunit HisH [Microcoleus sp. PH2017_06_SFM_O_A]MCC35042